MTDTYKCTIVDDDGYVWVWDGARMACVNSGEDRDDYPLDMPVNKGRHAASFKDALDMLVVDGYISAETAAGHLQAFEEGNTYKD